MSWAYLSFSPFFQVFQYPKATLSREKVLPMHQTSADGVEDMSMLGDLHEAAILLNLHQRYQQGNIYVSAHPFWLNGFWLASGLPLCMWSTDVILVSWGQELEGGFCLASSIIPVRSYPYQGGLFTSMEELPKHECSPLSLVVIAQLSILHEHPCLMSCHSHSPGSPLWLFHGL